MRLMSHTELQNELPNELLNELSNGPQNELQSRRFYRVEKSPVIGLLSQDSRLAASVDSVDVQMTIPLFATLLNWVLIYAICTIVQKGDKCHSVTLTVILGWLLVCAQEHFRYLNRQLQHYLNLRSSSISWHDYGMTILEIILEIMNCVDLDREALLKWKF